MMSVEERKKERKIFLSFFLLGVLMSLKDSRKKNCGMMSFERKKERKKKERKKNLGYDESFKRKKEKRKKEKLGS